MLKGFSLRDLFRSWGERVERRFDTPAFYLCGMPSAPLRKNLPETDHSIIARSRLMAGLNLCPWFAAASPAEKAEFRDIIASELSSEGAFFVPVKKAKTAIHRAVLYVMQQSHGTTAPIPNGLNEFIYHSADHAIRGMTLEDICSNARAFESVTAQPADYAAQRQRRITEELGLSR